MRERNRIDKTHVVHDMSHSMKKTRKKSTTENIHFIHTYTHWTHSICCSLCCCTVCDIWQCAISCSMKRYERDSPKHSLSPSAVPTNTNSKRIRIWIESIHSLTFFGSPHFDALRFAYALSHRGGSHECVCIRERTHIHANPIDITCMAVYGSQPRQPERIDIFCMRQNVNVA